MIYVLILLHIVLILHVTCYSMKWHNCISYTRGHCVKSDVCAWYWLFTILGECVVRLEIRTTSKIETYRYINNNNNKFPVFWHSKLGKIPTPPRVKDPNLYAVRRDHRW